MKCKQCNRRFKKNWEMSVHVRKEHPKRKMSGAALSEMKIEQDKSSEPVVTLPPPPKDTVVPRDTVEFRLVSPVKFCPRCGFNFAIFGFNPS